MKKNRLVCVCLLATMTLALPWQAMAWGFSWMQDVQKIVEKVAKQVAVVVLAPVATVIQEKMPSLTFGDYTQTRYPIVLVHGFMGFDTLPGVGQYWGLIPNALRLGGASVHVVKVSALNSTEERGEQLLKQVTQILASTGTQKVNLMGHSHGAPTARYVASVHPELVASVTSIAGVNKGALLPDLVLRQLPSGTSSLEFVKSVVKSLGQFIDSGSGGPNLPQDSLSSAKALSTAGSAKFNQAHPWGVPSTPCGEGDYIARGVAYYSWGGAQPLTDFWDPIDQVMSLASGLFQGAKNDGLVGSCNNHLGRVIRDDYKMNHMDLVNFMGKTGAEDPVAVFRQHANRLKHDGY